jgi:hypothetical protein
MKYLTLILALLVFCGFKAVPSKSIPDPISNSILKLEVGMTRQAVEELIQEEWKKSISSNWASGQSTYYENLELDEYYLLIRYDWKDVSPERMKKGGMLRVSSPDQLIIKPVEIQIRSRRSEQ